MNETHLALEQSNTIFDLLAVEKFEIIKPSSECAFEDGIMKFSGGSQYPVSDIIAALLVNPDKARKLHESGNIDLSCLDPLESEERTDLPSDHHEMLEHHRNRMSRLLDLSRSVLTEIDPTYKQEKDKGNGKASEMSIILGAISRALHSTIETRNTRKNRGTTIAISLVSEETRNMLHQEAILSGCDKPSLIKSVIDHLYSRLQSGISDVPGWECLGSVVTNEVTLRRLHT